MSRRSQSIERISLFVEELFASGKEPSYEIWGGVERPSNPISLDDLDRLIYTVEPEVGLAMEPEEERRPDILEFYRDKAGEWRWRRISFNGNVIADSGEGYENRTDCQATAFHVNGGKYTTRTIE